MQNQNLGFQYNNAVHQGGGHERGMEAHQASRATHHTAGRNQREGMGKCREWEGQDTQEAIMLNSFKLRQTGHTRPASATTSIAPQDPRCFRDAHVPVSLCWAGTVARLRSQQPVAACGGSGPGRAPVQRAHPGTPGQQSPPQPGSMTAWHRRWLQQGTGAWTAARLQHTRRPPRRRPPSATSSNYYQ